MRRARPLLSPGRRKTPPLARRVAGAITITAHPTPPRWRTISSRKARAPPSTGGLVEKGGGRGGAHAPTGLSNVVAVSAGGWHSLALKADGTVTGWGAKVYGEDSPPAGLSNVLAIAGGGQFSLALKNDSTVVAWGNGYSGVTNLPVLF